MIGEAVVAYGQPLERITLPTPSPQGTEVLLKVSHCGVCHSDVHIHDGHFDLGGGKKLDLSAGRTLPLIMGHEIEGVVAALGPDAKGVKLGDRVVAYPWIGCGACSICARGEEHLCAKAQHLGVVRPGGFADHCLVPHPRYLFDYAGIPDGLAATYMCSGLTAFSAIKKLGHARADDAVLIVGAGGVGMMGLQFARALEPWRVLVADIDEAKLASARAQGAAETYNPRDASAVKKLIADTKGGALGVVDFVGSEGSMTFATGAARRGGQVVVVGLFGGGFAMPIPMFPLRSLTIRGSFVGSLDETRDMMSLVKQGKIAPIPLEQRPLARANATLDDLRQGRVVGRVVLAP